MSGIPVGILPTKYIVKSRWVNTSALLSFSDLSPIGQTVLRQLITEELNPHWQVGLSQCLATYNDTLISHNTQMYETITSTYKPPRQIFEFDRLMGESQKNKVFGTVIYSNTLACFLVYFDDNTTLPLYEFMRQFTVTIIGIEDKTYREHLVEKINPVQIRGFITVENFSPTTIKNRHHKDFLNFLQGKEHWGLYKESTGVVVGSMVEKQIFIYDEIVYYDKPERIVVYDNKFGMYCTVPKQHILFYGESKEKIPLAMSLGGIKYIHYRWSPIT